MRDVFFHGTAGTYFPSPVQSPPFCPCSPLQDREFLPERDLLLRELHVIADEEPLRVLPLPVGHDAAVELGDGWQPAGAHQEPQSARRGAQTGSSTSQPHQKCPNFNTLGIPAQEAQASVPLRERESSM